MFFFSFMVREEVEEAIRDTPGDYLVFGEIDRRAPDGTPLCVLVGHAIDLATAKLVVSMAMSQHQYRNVVRYFVYTKEQIEEGLLFGKQEQRAKDN